MTVLVIVGGPLIAKGIMVRRPLVVRLLQSTGLEGGAVALLQRLRRRYGPGPVMLRLPGREQAVLLSPDDVRRVLAETPEPFETDSDEKHATLAHFEPEGSLISRGRDRVARRALNDQALESGCPIHSMAPHFREIIDQEIAALLSGPDDLSWGRFKDSWFRIVRRCLFGDAAADDRDLVAMLIRLRSAGNWSFLHPKRRVLRARFLSHVAAYLHAAPPGTLGAGLARRATTRSAAESQVGQWLFAFDAAGIATFRALALIVADAGITARARNDTAPGYPFLRACLLESVRLWPTTPAILRQSARPAAWNGSTMAEGTGILIHVPFLHRDDERLPFSHRFAPDVWLRGEADAWPLIPFSGGPGECPAKNLVLLLASNLMAALLTRNICLPPGGKLDINDLPETFDHFSLTLRHQAQSPLVAQRCS
ncbi:cytochrome P450 [Sphingomonas mucosissima]|nr:cytochrome P450 [Sphingomonas mucosissima]